MALDAEVPLPEPEPEPAAPEPAAPEPAAPEPAAPEPPPEPLYLPDEVQVPGFQETEPTLRVEHGQASLPTPSVELPPLPGESADETPAVTLAAPLEPPTDPVQGDEPPAEEAPETPSSTWKYALAGIFLSGLLVGGFLFVKRRRHAPKPPPPVQAAQPKAEPAPGVAVPPEAAKAEAETEAAKEAHAPQEEAKAKEEPRAKEDHAKESKGKEAKAEARPEPKVSTALADRLEALRKGDLVKAVAQGRQRVKETAAGHWALRLEIACQGDTIRHVADLFKGSKPDLFLMPMTLRDGRGCYQVLYGDFPSKEAAEKEAKRLPPAFTAEGNRAKPFKYGEIPAEQ